MTRKALIPRKKKLKGSMIKFLSYRWSGIISFESKTVKFKCPTKSKTTTKITKKKKRLIANNLTKEIEWKIYLRKAKNGE